MPVPLAGGGRRGSTGAAYVRNPQADAVLRGVANTPNSASRCFSPAPGEGEANGVLATAIADGQLSGICCGHPSIAGRLLDRRRERGRAIEIASRVVAYIEYPMEVRQVMKGDEAAQ